MIFIDTGAFIARFIQDDAYHEKANLFWEKLHREKYKLYTSNFVVDETITLLARKISVVYSLEKADLIYHGSGIEILRPDASTELQAIAWMSKFKDQVISFTDCISFALMKAHKLKHYFGFDKHFHIAGFEGFLPD